MKHLTTVCSVRSFGLLAAASTVLMMSCSKDADYDGLTESDGIDLSFNIAPGGLTLPFGSFDRIYLTELLDTADIDVLERYPDGRYYIAQDGEISESNFKVDKVTFDIHPNISPSDYNFAATLPGDISSYIEANKEHLQSLSGGTTTFDLSVLSNINPEWNAFPIALDKPGITFSDVDFSIDAESVDGLKEIHTIQPADPIDVTLTFSVNLPTSIEGYDIILENLEIILPKFVVLSNGTSTYRLPGDKKKLHIQAGAEKAVWQETITIETLDFTRTDEGKLETKDGKLNCLGQVTITTDIRMENYNIAASNILYDLPTNTFTFKNELSVAPAIALNTIVLKEVTGLFDPTIDPVTADVDIDLGDDMDFLTGNQTELNFVNPQIHLTLTNTSPVKIEADITLEADNGHSVHYKDVDLTPVQGSQKDITLQSQPGDVAQSIYGNPELSTFLSPIPTHVWVTVRPQTDSEHSYTLSLGEDIFVSGAYDLTVPLEFRDVHIHYEEVIENLFGEGDDAKDVTDRLPAIDRESEVTLSFTLTNAIPLGLNISLSANNHDGVEDKSLVSFADGQKVTIEAATDQPVKQEKKVGILMPRTADVRDLILVVEADGSNGALNANQYVKFDDIKLLLKNLKVDLNDKD